MIPAGELDGMRFATESAMPDVCTVRRLEWPGAAINATTGLYTPATPTTVYTGPCRIRPDGQSNDALQQGEGQVSLLPYLLTVPYDAGPFAIGDVAEVTSSADPHITSRSFRVTGNPAGSWQIDQRLAVEEVIDRA